MSESSPASVRARLGHPIVDVDGHVLEPMPLFFDVLREVGGGATLERYRRHAAAVVRAAPERIDAAQALMGWWATPARHTLDRMTASLPRLLHQRMDELGLDFSVLYPTFLMTAPCIADEELRTLACRAYNRFAAEQYAEFSDRLTPVAMIPMHTPAEALAELQHAIVERGLKTVMLAGYVRRPVPRVHRERPELDGLVDRLDSFGIDSEHDYDPVWARCQELGVAPSFHSALENWGPRRSPSSYMFNHCGKFAEGAELVCRSLYLGGVTRRFPSLNFAFMEGGVGWAASLYATMVSRWEKRNGAVIHNLDPAELDQALFAELLEMYAEPRLVQHRDAFLASILGAWPELPAELDEWAACGIETREDHRERFAERFFIGCEADDPLNPLAFDTKLHPCGARFRAVLGSDIGHHDVSDMRDVVPEAYEMLERGLVDEADFRDFVLRDPVRLHAEMNPEFFAGTPVESAAAEILRAGR